MQQLKLDGKHDVEEMVKDWCKQNLHHQGRRGVWIDNIYDTKNDAIVPHGRLHKTIHIGVFKTFDNGFLNVYSFKYEYMFSCSETKQKDNYEYTTIDVNVLVNEQIMKKCRNE